MAKTLEELERDVDKLKVRVHNLRKQQAGKERAYSQTFPKTVELTKRIEENDEIVVLTSGWFYNAGSNQQLCITHSTEWTGSYHALTFNVTQTNGLALPTSSMVSLFWHAIAV